ncbi:MAG TPA: ankyrin repeat domain-containing protein, partial [Candidatus Babeliales bacterium]|nr:ankyrin repeat domain-containing protein [Candidatus Babeliales bacterium]
MLRNGEINMLRLQKLRLQRRLTFMGLLVLMSCCAQITPLHGADGSGAPISGADGTGGSAVGVLNAEKQANGAALFTAAGGNDIATVTRLLALPPALLDINYANQYGYTALMRAADRGHTDVVQLLLAQTGIAINHANQYGETALNQAAVNDHTAIVQALLAQAGIEINRADRWGDTALRRAAAYGHTAILQALIGAGIEINRADRWGDTALRRAAAYGHTAIVQALIGAGAEIPASLGAHPQISTIPLALRQLPALVRALISPYYHQAVRALAEPSLAAALASCDLSTVDLDVNKFMIVPGTEIVPGGPVATGVARLETEIGPETLPELFSVLDLAIYSCQPAVVDQLLMAGMDPTQLAQQTQALLAHFDPAFSGVADAKGAEAAVDADSAAIAQMIYYATMAQSAEVQNRISGL